MSCRKKRCQIKNYKKCRCIYKSLKMMIGRKKTPKKTKNESIEIRKRRLKNTTIQKKEARRRKERKVTE